ncbi:hypothetical protein Tco_0400118, partial [Tanacetum coccineum]
MFVFESGRTRAGDTIYKQIGRRNKKLVMAHRVAVKWKVASVMTLLNQLQPAYEANISNVALNIGLDGWAGLRFQSKFCDFQTVVSCMVAADDGIEVSAGVCLRHPLKGTKGVIRGAPLLQLEVSTMYVQ